MLKTLLVILLFLLISVQMFSQSAENEIIIADSAISEYFGSLSRIDENIYCLYNKNDTSNPYGQYQSRLLRIQPGGDTTWLDFTKIDSTVHFMDMIVNSAGNLLLAGNIYITQNPKKYWFCEVSPDLNIIWEKEFSFESDSNFIYSSCLGQFNSGNYLYVANIKDIQTSDAYMCAINISNVGDSISYHVFDPSVSGRINSITSNSSTITLHIVHSDFGSPYHCKLLTIDSIYNTLAFSPYPISSYDDPFYTITSSTGDYLSFGTYWYSGEYYLKAAIFDTISGVLINTNLTNGEEYVYAAWNRGIDYYYNNQIYVAGMYHVQPSWPDFPNEYYIACLSGDLTLKHEVILGGDYYYNIHNVLATANGGVTIAGSIYDPVSHSYQHDAYLLTLDSAVFVGQKEFGRLSPDDLLEIYPNPGSDLINIRSGDKNSLLEIFDATGQKVNSEVIGACDGQINISTWPRGVYFIRQINSKKRVLSTTFIKN